jgi:hypothetical protein
VRASHAHRQNSTLVVLELRVERYDDGADAADGEERGHERRAVGQDQRHRVAGSDALGGEAVGDALDAVEELGVGEAFGVVDERRGIGSCAGVGGEAGGHHGRTAGCLRRR